MNVQPRRSRNRCRRDSRREASPIRVSPCNYYSNWEWSYCYERSYEVLPTVLFDADVVRRPWWPTQVVLQLYMYYRNYSYSDELAARRWELLIYICCLVRSKILNQWKKIPFSEQSKLLFLTRFKRHLAALNPISRLQSLKKSDFFRNNEIYVLYLFILI